MKIPSPRSTLKAYQKGLERALAAEPMTKAQHQAHDRIMACLTAFDGIPLGRILSNGIIGICSQCGSDDIYYGLSGDQDKYHCGNCGALRDDPDIVTFPKYTGDQLIRKSKFINAKDE